MLRAWRLPGGALACVDQDSPDSPTWGGRIVRSDVYFPARTSQQQALVILRVLLPADAVTTLRAGGMNPDWVPHPEGTCYDAEYRSASLGRAVAAFDPKWKDPGAAQVSLYSGHATGDGSDSIYRADAVHQASISIGSMDGTPNC
jgi:hypothetical protein